MLLSHTLTLGAEATTEDERRLLKDLFKNYDTDIRPVANIKETLPITVSLSFNQLMDLVGVFKFTKGIHCTALHHAHHTPHLFCYT